MEINRKGHRHTLLQQIHQRALRKAKTGLTFTGRCGGGLGVAPQS
jgi:hypothetical protein